MDRRINTQFYLSYQSEHLKRDVNPEQNHSVSIMSQTTYFLNTFDSGLDGWSIDAGWYRTDINYHSPDYSMNSVENNSSLYQMWSLTSPVYPLPEPPLNETIHFSFWLRNDMLDGNGDGDDYIDDNFSLLLLDVVASDDIWNTTNFNSIDDNSYWCGDDELNGYGDIWVQYLDTPKVFLQPDSELTAMMKWAIEDTLGASSEGIEAICENGDNTIDGWDQANVQISINSGVTWEVLMGNDPYDFQCGYGTVYNGFTGLPGWSGFEDWHEVTFNLSEYAGEIPIIRFAFYSDPSWSTINEEVLTGLQIDNIRIRTTNKTIFEDNADDNPQMIGSGENWVEQFYDYWDDGIVSDTGTPQPGSLTWEEYNPGTAYVGNTLQDITEFAGKDVRFRFQTVFDGNSDGGIGTGLFIDDFRIYSETTEVYPPPPSNLVAENNDGNVILTWSNYLNYEGEYEHILDSGDDALFGESTIDCPDLTDCSTFIGNKFFIPGNSTVDSVSVYNFNQGGTEIAIAAFSMVGQYFNYIPTFEDIVSVYSQGWNTFAVDGWDFTKPYIIAQSITDDISASFDINSPPYGFLLSNNTWEFTDTGYLGIRAQITKEGYNVTYNIHRQGINESDFTIINFGVVDSTYIDVNTTDNELYYYAISATYPDGGISELSISQSITVIPVLPASYHEQSWDDGSFQDSFVVESGDSLAVKYSASNNGQQIVRFKWYQIDDGGIIEIVYWDNSEDGFPGNILHSITITGFNAISGWNEYDLSQKDWNISGEFWIGIRAYSTTSPIAIDYDVGSNTSMHRTTVSEWSTINDWNLAIRVFLDCESQNFDECGVCDGDNLTCINCAGEINGDAQIDECGVCNGDNSSCADCAGVVNGDSLEDECETCDSDASNDCLQDCAGDWGGTAVNDECGVCNGDNSSCTDCAGDINGSAYADPNCFTSIPGDICVGGTTDLTACVQDCSGEWGGEAEDDECGVCGGDNSTCTDCAGDINGSAYADPNCFTSSPGDICVGGTTDLTACVQDCSGDWGGEAEDDECGVCGGSVTDPEECISECEDGETLGCDNSCALDGTQTVYDLCISETNPQGICLGDNSTCLDCDNVPNGTSFTDSCGECVGLDDTSCVQGCDGVFANNGTHLLEDECGVCNGDKSSCADCAGDVNGDSLEDECGTCDADSSNDCVQACDGVWGGTAVDDECGVCGGDNSTCSDCDNVANGVSLEDECGTCDADSSNDCVQDCNGDWGGTAVDDECTFPICSGGNTELIANASCTDCNGDVNGDLVEDYCGVCDGNDSTCTGCIDQNADNYDVNATITCLDCCTFELSNNELITPIYFEIVNLFPNPFNPQINIEYSVPNTSQIRVSVYNLRGQEIDRLVDEIQNTGFYSVTWMASEQNSGIFFIQVRSNQEIINRKIMYLK